MFVVRVTDSNDIRALSGSKDFELLMKVDTVSSPDESRTLSAEFIGLNPDKLDFNAWVKQVWSVIKLRNNAIIYGKKRK